jgi:pimeloyl-ACP methyl ester carboxylesterase
MPSLVTDSGLTLHYEDDCYALPWTSPEVLLLVNGIETSLMWWGWMPIIGASMRVIRPDMRGYGGSSVPPVSSGLGWTLNELIGDLLQLLDHLRLPAVHLVGSKFGSAVALHLASEHPERVSTLTLLSPFIKEVPSLVPRSRRWTVLSGLPS